MDIEGGPSVGHLPTHVTEKTRSSYGVHDTLRYGVPSACKERRRFTSAKDDITPAHPLEHAQANYAASQEALRMKVLRNAQGRHMPLRLQMERSIVSRIQRMPPLESSMIALETLTGMDTRLSVAEIYNPPSEAPVTVDTHLAMQQRLRMN